MLIRILTATALGLAATSTAFAAPKDVKGCMDSVFAQAKAAESKKVSGKKAEKIEGMLGKMEAHCLAKKFAAADKVGGQIEKAIAK